MNYSLEIREHNKQPHLDIEDAIQKQKNGLFTFIIRINNGNVVDFSVVEYADARKYLILKQIIIEEFTIPRNTSNGDQPNPIRTDNSKRTAP